MGPIPDLPCVSADQNSSTVLPTGVSAPSPVTTTRRGSTALGVVLDVLDGVPDRHDLLGVLVGDLDVEVLLQRHHQLDRVERVGAEVLDELRARSDVVFLHAELLADDFLHLLLDRFGHQPITSIGKYLDSEPLKRRLASPGAAQLLLPRAVEASPRVAERRSAPTATTCTGRR